MIWIILFCFPMFLNVLALPSRSMDVNNGTVNDAVMVADASDAEPLRSPCTVPCEMTTKLMLDEKHSYCNNLQHAMTTYTRSTRKLIRDLMEEQQKTLEFLSGQVIELMSKFQLLNLEVQRNNNDMFSWKHTHAHGRDCSDIKETLESVSPKIPSGVYIVQPDNTELLFEVFCEMDYMEGGWTVIQRRTDGLTDFKRTWSDYLDGFGSLPGEHWLGLRKLFAIVNQKNTRFQLHVSLTSQDDAVAYASYDNFWLEDETRSFAIHLGRYVGSAGDAFRGYDQEQNQDTAPFSTLDVDNDGCVPFCTFNNTIAESCSTRYNNTGWWFNQCGRANLNGSPLDQDVSTRPYLHWDTWTKNGQAVSIKSVTMKVRRVEGSNLK